MNRRTLKVLGSLEIPECSLQKMHEEKCSETAQHCPICQETWQTHTKWSNYLIHIKKKNPGRSAIREWSWQQPGLSPAPFCHLHPQYKCKTVKTQGEAELQWIHSDAGPEPLTGDINYSAVTIALPVCKWMLSSNCAGPAGALMNLPEDRPGRRRLGLPGHPDPLSPLPVALCSAWRALPSHLLRLPRR